MNSTTWIVVADASRARVFSTNLTEKNKPWQFVHSMTHPESRITDGKLMSDRPGRSQSSSAHGGRSGLESVTPPKEVEFEHFAHELAKYLEHGQKTNLFGRLMLVAPPHFLGLLKKTLHTSVSKLIAGTVDKDFTQTTEADLHKHLASDLPTRA